VDVLLEAAGIYEREFEGALTLIVGDGELRGRLEAQAVDRGLKGVRFLGHLSQVQVAELLNAADVSVVPSRVEPFGLVAVEALACGTPVVATNEGGLPEFVDERVGALVDVGDPHGLADAILREVRTDAKGRKGAFAAEYALKRFSWSGRVAEIIELYEQVLRSDERTASAVL
jgi:glycosyltransferase involved in cell wall biosynthesis